MVKLFNVGITINGAEIEQRVIPVFAEDAKEAIEKVESIYGEVLIAWVEGSIE